MNKRELSRDSGSRKPKSWAEEAVEDCPSMMTPAEVARVLRVSSRTVGRWIAGNEITHSHVGRCVRIPRRAVAELLDRGAS